MTRIATPECGVNFATTDNFDVRNYVSQVAWWAAGSAGQTPGRGADDKCRGISVR